MYNSDISMQLFIVIMTHLLCRNAPTHYFGCYQTCFIHFFTTFARWNILVFSPELAAFRHCFCRKQRASRKKRCLVGAIYQAWHLLRG